MVEEQQKSAKLIETNKTIAAGLASVVAALFTSKLGVAGTLIGTALTAMTVTMGMSILQAQLGRAQNTLSGLPSTVRGRLSTQQIRMPGKPNAEPNPEPPPPPEPRGGRSASLLERLRSIPGYLKGLSPAARRRVLLSGALAGLLATAIGLSGITGIELVGGKPLSCMVWSCPAETASGGAEGGGSGTSLTRAFGGGSPSTDTQNVPLQDAPQQGAPAGGGGQFQQQQQPAGQPQQGDPAFPVEPAPQDSGQQQPGGTPQDDDSAQPQPGDEPAPGAGGEQPTPSPDR